MEDFYRDELIDKDILCSSYTCNFEVSEGYWEVGMLKAEYDTDSDSIELP